MRKITQLEEKAKELGRIDIPKKLHTDNGKIYGVYKDGSKQPLNEDDLVKLIQKLEETAINKAGFKKSDGKAPEGVRIGKYLITEDLQNIMIVFGNDWD